MIRISVPSNIDRPSIIIRRSKIYGDVYTSGEVVYSGDKKESHDDFSITEDGYYYYGIEFHNAGTQKIRTIPTGQTFIRDWGTLLPYVKSNLATYGTPFQSGSNGGGVVLYDDGGSDVIPTYASIYGKIADIAATALADFNTTGTTCKVTTSNQSVASSQKVCAGVLDGKIVSIPAQSTNIVQINGYHNRVGPAVAVLAEYLNNNPEESEIVAGGYRWRTRIMDRATVNRCRAYLLRMNSNTSMSLGGFQIGNISGMVINDPEAAVSNTTVTWTNSGNSSEFGESSSTMTAMNTGLFIYFEMIGPA